MLQDISWKCLDTNKLCLEPSFTGSRFLIRLPVLLPAGIMSRRMSQRINAEKVSIHACLPADNAQQSEEAYHLGSNASFPWVGVL